MQQMNDYPEDMKHPDTTALLAEIAQLKQEVERLKSRSALAQSEWRLRQAQSIAGMGWWDWDVKTDKTIWSDELFEMYGIDPATFTGKGADYFEFTHPEDRQMQADNIALAFAEAAGIPTPVDHRSHINLNPVGFRLIRPDGTIRHVHGDAVAIMDDNGVPERMLGILFDVTEKVEAERERERLLAALEQLGDEVMITDTTFHLIYVNHAFEIATGYASDEVIGKHLRIFRTDKHDELFYKQLYDTITAGNTWRGRIFNRRKDGSIFEEDTTISPLLSGSGQVTGYTVIKRDITREALFEKAKSYFASATSHELRTPVVKAQLLENYLLRAINEPDPQGTVAQALAVATQVRIDLARLIEATQIYTRLSQGLKPQFFPFPLRPLLSLSVQQAMIGAQEEKRKVSIALDGGDALMTYPFLGEQEMIRIAVDEILSNAVKYTPDGGQVFVRLMQDDHQFTITITDSGIGLFPTQFATLTQPFYSCESVDNHFTSKYAHHGGGIGLGLTIAQMIVEYHLGQLSISSAGPNQGTTITLTFPSHR